MTEGYNREYYLVRRGYYQSYYQQNKKSSEIRKYLSCVVCCKQIKNRGFMAKSCSEACSRILFNETLSRYYLRNKTILQKKASARYQIKKAARKPLIITCAFCAKKSQIHDRKRKYCSLDCAKNRQLQKIKA